jgi:hypothetical protein
MLSYQYGQMIQIFLFYFLLNFEKIASDPIDNLFKYPSLNRELKVR